MTIELRDQVFFGLSWSFLSKIFWQLTKALTSIILTRLLNPDEFGVYAMLLTVTNFTQLFGELGFTKIIVQKKSIPKHYYSTIFWFNLLAGVLLSLIVSLFAPFISDFYNQTELIDLLRVFSLDFILYSLTIVQLGILMREMKFRKLAIIDILSVFISASIGISLAFIGAGVWSLIAQTLSFTASRAITIWIISSWRPSLNYNWRFIVDDLRFGGSLLGAQLLNQITRNIDYILIGYYFSATQLGFYNRAYSLSMIPVAIVVQVVSKVIFPAFSKIQNDNKRIRLAFLRVIQMVGFIIFPILTGAIVVADKFISLIFGYKWIEMVTIFQVLSFTALIQSISKLDGNLYYSKGRADLQLKVGLGIKTFEILGIIIGLNWGILGVAIGYSIGVLMGVYPNYYYAGSLVNLRFKEIIITLFPTFTISIGMFIGVYLFDIFLETKVSGWFELLLNVSVGAVVYTLLSVIFKLKPLSELRKHIPLFFVKSEI